MVEDSDFKYGSRYLYPVMHPGQWMAVEGDMLRLADCETVGFVHTYARVKQEVHDGPFSKFV